MVVLCGAIAFVCYRVGNDSGYVDGWQEGRITEQLYSQLQKDLKEDKHLEDRDIEREIIYTYTLYSYNKEPKAKEAKHLSNLLKDYVFWQIE